MSTIIVFHASTNWELVKVLLEFVHRLVVDVIIGTNIDHSDRLGYTSFAGSDMIKKYTSLAPSVAVSSVSQANSMTEDKRLSEMSRRYGFAGKLNIGKQ